jgi:hypothetical protein
MMKVSILFLVLTTAMFAADKPKPSPTPDAPPAPVPTQILTAKKVFLSYGEGDSFPGPADQLYNQFYAAIKNWGRFEIVGAPADADLIFQIRFVMPPTGPEYRVVIDDPNTHVTLWWIIEHVKTAFFAKHFEQNSQDAMADLVRQIKFLMSQSTLIPDGAPQ